MNKEFSKFDDIEFHCLKSPTNTNAVDIDKTLIFYKSLCGEKGFKYFID